MEDLDIALNSRLLAAERVAASAMCKLAEVRRQYVESLGDYRDALVKALRVQYVQDVLKASTAPMTVKEVFNAIKRPDLFASPARLSEWFTRNDGQYGIKALEGKRVGRGGSIQYVYTEPVSSS
jgi:hypothetical protein